MQAPAPTHCSNSTASGTVSSVQLGTDQACHASPSEYSKRYIAHKSAAPPAPCVREAATSSVAMQGCAPSYKCAHPETFCAPDSSEISCARAPHSATRSLSIRAARLHIGTVQGFRHVASQTCEQHACRSEAKAQFAAPPQGIRNSSTAARSAAQPAAAQTMSSFAASPPEAAPKLWCSTMHAALSRPHGAGALQAAGQPRMKHPGCNIITGGPPLNNNAHFECFEPAATVCKARAELD